MAHRDCTQWHTGIVHNGTQGLLCFLTQSLCALISYAPPTQREHLSRMLWSCSRVFICVCPIARECMLPRARTATRNKVLFSFAFPLQWPLLRLIHNQIIAYPYCRLPYHIVLSHQYPPPRPILLPYTQCRPPLPSSAACLRQGSLWGKLQQRSGRQDCCALGRMHSLSACLHQVRAYGMCAADQRSRIAWGSSHRTGVTLCVCTAAYAAWQGCTPQGVRDVDGRALVAVGGPRRRAGLALVQHVV